MVPRGKSFICFVIPAKTLRLLSATSSLTSTSSCPVHVPSFAFRRILAVFVNETMTTPELSAIGRAKSAPGESATHRLSDYSFLRIASSCATNPSCPYQVAPPWSRATSNCYVSECLFHYPASYNYPDSAGSPSQCFRLSWIPTRHPATTI